MSTREKLNDGLKDAMRKNDDLRKRCIRMALAGIKQAEIDSRTPADESVVISILQKEIKSRKEASADAEKAGRQDLIIIAKNEIHVFESFLPQPLSEEALKDLIQSAITEISASGPGDLGKVIKLSKSRVQGRASGEQVSRIAKELLQP